MANKKKSRPALPDRAINQLCRVSNISSAGLNQILLNIRTTIYDFFVVAYLFVRPKASDWAHVAWSLYKRNYAKCKLTRNGALAVELLR